MNVALASGRERIESIRASENGRFSPVFPMFGIGDVKNRRPVRLVLAGEWVDLRAHLVADVGYPVLTLLFDEGLSGAPTLQVAEAHVFHIALLGL